ncbi:hypothetical protein TNCV_3898061 [Trichonephila clavipes]|nr:hypothetical protein TNCV_3898061 [Trichonephila clavipes]
MSTGTRLQMFWSMRAAIKILHMVTGLFLRNCYPGQTKYQFLMEIDQWYERNRPGATLVGISSRRGKTTLAKLHRGHTRAHWHVVGLKVYSSCPNCIVTRAAPAHILACIGCHKSHLFLSPDTVLYCLKTHGLWTSSRCFCRSSGIKNNTHRHDNTIHIFGIGVIRSCILVIMEEIKMQTQDLL